MVEFVAEVPGSYQLVDHAMFRAFNRGAMAMLEVSGEPRREIFSGVQAESLYNPGTHLERAVAATQEPAPAVVQPSTASRSPITASRSTRIMASRFTRRSALLAISPTVADCRMLFRRLRTRTFCRRIRIARSACCCKA
jgi:hypothetical protein